MGQHYKVVMSAHCHKWVPILRCCKDVKLPKPTNIILWPSWVLFHCASNIVHQWWSRNKYALSTIVYLSLYLMRYFDHTCLTNKGTHTYIKKNSWEPAPTIPTFAKSWGEIFYFRKYLERPVAPTTLTAYLSMCAVSFGSTSKYFCVNTWNSFCSGKTRTTTKR